MVLTANLNVDYRRPITADGVYLVRVWAERVDKMKKIYLGASISNWEGEVLVEATALYIVKQ